MLFCADRGSQKQLARSEMSVGIDSFIVGTARYNGSAQYRDHSLKAGSQSDARPRVRRVVKFREW